MKEEVEEVLGDKKVVIDEDLDKLVYTEQVILCVNFDSRFCLMNEI